MTDPYRDDFRRALFAVVAALVWRPLVFLACAAAVVVSSGLVVWGLVSLFRWWGG